MGLSLIASDLPDAPHKAPEMPWFVVRDDESFAVDAEVWIEGLRLCAVLPQFHGCEAVGVRDVCVGGEVEEVAVRAELGFGPAGVVGFDHAGEDGEVAYADYAGGPEGAGLEGGC